MNIQDIRNNIKNVNNDPLMAAVKTVYSVTGSSASVEPSDIEKQRAGQELFGKLVSLPIGVRIIEEVIAEHKAEWIIPDNYRNKKRIILYCHGGGYTCGNINYARVLGAKLAVNTGMTVLTFEYRLAPEYKYPAPIDDANEIWDYLMQLGYGARDVILAGDSAGGNLALELTIRLREQDRFLPKALILFSPWTDMTMSGESYKTRVKQDPMITEAYVKAVRGAYLGDMQDYSDYHVSPLFADFEGFPPTLIQVGDNEILLSDSVSLSDRMTEKGVLNRIEIFDNGWHVFQQMPIIRAAKAMQKVDDFLLEIL